MSPAAKNTLFIDGIGPAMGARVATTAVAGDGWRGFRIDASEAMGLAAIDDPARGATGECHRLVLLLRDRALLVVDRIRRSQPSLMESRLHTFADVEVGCEGVVVRGRHHQLHLAHAASAPIVVRRASGMPTDPRREPDTAIRCLGAAKTRVLTIATLCTPAGAGRVSLNEHVGGGVVEVRGPIQLDLAYVGALDCSPRSSARP